MEEFLYYHKLLESNFFKDDNPLIIAEIYLLSFSKPGNNFNFSEQFLKKFYLNVILTINKIIIIIIK